jgi:hypothetical protein
MFPEFYFFDCHSCHRRISDDPRFRPGALANPARPIPAGMPPFNDENMIMLAAAAAAGIRNDINAAYRAVHDPNDYDPASFRASLGRAATAIRRLR